MAQAIMDPEQVRRFAEELKRFNTDLKDKIVSLQARFAALGDTWQDQEHTKFAEEFKQTMKAFKRFVEISNQHTPYRDLSQAAQHAALAAGLAGASAR